MNMKYLGWEVWFFSKAVPDFGICYFAIAPEIDEGEMSGTSYWAAFEKLRKKIDDVESMMTYEVDDSEAPF